MTHVSHKQVSGKVFKKIEQKFVHILTDLKGERESREFLFEFFTRTERLMLAKRLMLIYMLSQEVPFSIIEKTLQMSPSTVGRFVEELDRGRYAQIIPLLRKKHTANILAKELDTLLSFGLPSRDKNRWKWLKKLPE